MKNYLRANSRVAKKNSAAKGLRVQSIKCAGEVGPGLRCMFPESNEIWNDDSRYDG